MWVWEHALFDYNPKRPGSTKKDKTVEVITKADHDAALRRAKAEGLDDAAKAICMYCNDPEWQKRDEDDNHESPYTRTMYPCAAYKIHDLIRKLDARAAQIEEGAK